MVRSVAGRFLRMRGCEDIGLREFMLADAGLLDDKDLACRAILVYATYSAVNLFRKIGRSPSTAVAADALEQFCKAAVAGHSRSAAIVDSLWITDVQS